METAPAHEASRRWLPRPDLTTVVSMVLGAAYFTASRGVENFYPFSVLDMYAAQRRGSPSHIVAVDSRGEAHEVSAYVGWRCDGPLSEQNAVCSPSIEDMISIG